MTTPLPELEPFVYRLELFTGGLLITGLYELPLYRRLSDAVNSEMRRYITLHNATIAALDRPKQAQRAATMLVDRAETFVITALEEPSPPPGYRRQEYHVRDVQTLMFVTGVLAVHADFHKRPDLSLPDVLETFTEDFVRLTNAAIHIRGSAPIVRGFAMLNRAHIQAVYPLAQATDLATMQVPTPPSYDSSS